MMGARERVRPLKLGQVARYEGVAGREAPYIDCFGKYMEWSLVAPSSGRAVPSGGRFRRGARAAVRRPKGERVPEAPGRSGAERSGGRARSAPFP